MVMLLNIQVFVSPAITKGDDKHTSLSLWSHIIGQPQVDGCWRVAMRGISVFHTQLNKSPNSHIVREYRS